MKTRINENTKVTLTVGQLKRLVKEETVYAQVKGRVAFHMEWTSDYDGDEAISRSPLPFSDIMNNVDKLEDEYEIEDERTLKDLYREVNRERWHFKGLDKGEYVYVFRSATDAEQFKQYCVDMIENSEWPTLVRNVKVNGDTITWRSNETTSSWIAPNGYGHSVQRWFNFKCRIYIEPID